MSAGTFGSGGDRCRDRGADELPAGLPGALVHDVEGHVQESEALELASTGEGPHIDGAQTDGPDELQDDGLGGLVITGHEAIELDALGDRVDLAAGEQGVEGLDDG